MYIMKRSLTAAFLLWLTCAAAQAVVLTADTTTGIQSVIESAVDGDEIQVQPGYYTENIDFLHKTLHLVAVGGPAKTTIDGNNNTTVRIQGPASIQGFTITGGSASFGAGMEVSGDGTLIRNNVFSGNAQGAGGYGAAIGGNNASPVIDRNIFRNNSSDMQFLSGVVAFVNGSEPVITNNIFENNQSRAINLTLPQGNHAQVINNTIVNNRVGIYVDRRVDSQAIEIRNNILADNEVGLYAPFGGDAYNPVFTHNLLWNNDVQYYNVEDQTGLNGNLVADPLFTNGQYLLGKKSPARDAGTDTNAPDHDFRNRTRPQDGNGDGIAAPDIGAQEGGSLGAGLLVLMLGAWLRRRS